MDDLKSYKDEYSGPKSCRDCLWMKHYPGKRKVKGGTSYYQLYRCVKRLLVTTYKSKAVVRDGPEKIKEFRIYSGDYRNRVKNPFKAWKIANACPEFNDMDNDENPKEINNIEDKMYKEIGAEW